MGVVVVVLCFDLVQPPLNIISILLALEVVGVVVVVLCFDLVQPPTQYY